MFLTPAQSEIAKDLHRFRVLCCGRRFGKTLLGVEEIKGKAVAKDSHIAYIATTYAQARDIVWERLKKELQSIIIIANESRLELKVKNFQGGQSLITLRGWESIETLRGLAFDFIVIDEVASMSNFWSNWSEIIRPTLTDKKGEVMFISTPIGFNHFYDLFNLEAKDKDFKSFHFTTYDNPHMPKDEIDKASQELTPDRFAQEYLADFRKSEGLVYKEFSREKHLYEEFPKDKYTGNEWSYEKVAGVDFGYKNPAAVLEIRIHNEDFYVENEWYKRERTDAQIAEYVAACKFNYVYADPESPGAIEELQRKHVNVREVVKGKDSVKAGIQKVREMFLANKLHINQKCLNLIQELETYSYDSDDAMAGNEKPVKDHDHALDALRYVVMMKNVSSYSPEDDRTNVMSEAEKYGLFPSLG